MSNVYVNIYFLRALISLAFICVCAFTLAAETPSASSTDHQMQTARVMQYLIGPSDILSISVLNRSDLDRTVTVRPDGSLSYALIGDISAVGLTPIELQRNMEDALGEFINIIPGEVTVVVDAVQSYKVSVLGEVRLPGRFEFHNQVSVLDALAEAGGLTEFADSSKILILRPYKGETQRIRFDYRKFAKSADNNVSLLIFPGDIILVP